MRVIAGKARRLQLKTVAGMETRPTTDRTKETLFNIINYDLAGSNFLDLFSGSGAIGIEALSRGARTAYFVENSRMAIQCIKDNLHFTKLMNDAVVMNETVQSAVENLNNKKIYFDFVFMDPPYNKQLEKAILEQLHQTTIIDHNSVIIVEASLETDFSYLESIGFCLVREKNYKTNKHVFIKKRGD